MPKERSTTHESTPQGRVRIQWRDMGVHRSKANSTAVTRLLTTVDMASTELKLPDAIPCTTVFTDRPLICAKINAATNSATA